VTLKALRTNASFKTVEETPELFVRKILRAALGSTHNLQFVDHHFVVHSPNGFYRFLVSHWVIPAFLTRQTPGRLSSSRRLCGGPSWESGKNTATAIHCMHRVGLILGDQSEVSPMVAITESTRSGVTRQIFSLESQSTSSDG
jgi:hypothetical protein